MYFLLEKNESHTFRSIFTSYFTRTRKDQNKLEVLKLKFIFTKSEMKKS